MSAAAPSPSRVQRPSFPTLALGVIGAVLEFLNQVTFKFPTPWSQVITFGLFAIAVFGVSPLTGAAFRNALHISPKVATVLTTIATLLAAAITTFAISGTIKGILLAVVAFMAFVGFGPNILSAFRRPPVVAPPPGSAKARRA